MAAAFQGQIRDAAMHIDALVGKNEDLGFQQLVL